MKSGIYMIMNNINEKKYIGSAKNIDKRWYEHRYTLNKNCHDNSLLQNAWNKYGKNNFSFIIIELIDPIKLVEREQYYINYYNACNKKYGYNLSPTAGNTLGFKFSEESKLKMSIAKKGKPMRKNYIMSDETKRKIGDANRIKQLGRVHSEETKEKMRKPHGSMSEETKKKISNWRLGLVPSQKNGKLNLIIKKIQSKTQNNKIINRGENNGMATTTADEVISIRNDHSNGMTIKQLQEKYNKNYMFIYKIVNRIRWSWLDQPKQL